MKALPLLAAVALLASCAGPPQTYTDFARSANAATGSTLVLAPMKEIIGIDGRLTTPGMRDWFAPSFHRRKEFIVPAGRHVVTVLKIYSGKPMGNGSFQKDVTLHALTALEVRCQPGSRHEIYDPDTSVTYGNVTRTTRTPMMAVREVGPDGLVMKPAAPAYGTTSPKDLRGSLFPHEVSASSFSEAQMQHFVTHRAPAARSGVSFTETFENVPRSGSSGATWIQDSLLP